MKEVISGIAGCAIILGIIVCLASIIYGLCIVGLALLVLIVLVSWTK